jgi:hypothetical protein
MEASDIEGEDSMRLRSLLGLILMIALSGCAGLNQFPKPLQKPSTELAARDPEYVIAVTNIGTAATPTAKKLIRNQEITRRLRVIDLNFNDFQTKLAKENVRASFGVAVVQVGVGAAGSLVSETASQILSAISGGLAGAQQAYAKAALFDQALSSLLAQMVASRKAILVKIYEGMSRNIDEYSLAEASQDLEAYYFSGSLPGAIIATSADAKVKIDDAEDRLEAFRENSFFASKSGDRINAYIFPPDGNPANPVNVPNRNSIINWINTDPDATAIAGLPIANFVTNKKLEKLRQQAIKDLTIP